MHIVLATDRRCVLGCAAALRSIAAHVPPDRPLHLHLIADQLTGEDVRALEASAAAAGRSFTLQVIGFTGERVQHLLRSKLITRTSYARLLIGELLSTEITRVIYLDSDLVVERDLAELWDTDLQGRTIAAVDNERWQDSAVHRARLGTAGAYFNAGVLLIDLARWRAEEAGARALQRAEALGERLILHDQDALNMVFDGRWLPLEQRWNIWVTDPTLPADARAIYHYMGAPKPWQPDYTLPHREVFFRWLDQSAFAGWRPWNPAGLGAATARLKRRIPHWPTVVRMLRQRLGVGAQTSAAREAAPFS